ncbi:ATP-binding protein [Actinacidiphila oryziradicis]|uniref:histidine kinase n=1 Tax=Actinacidiphila oryziradicis TaxID=2571141 RepID=A0A4U0RYE9_9ACTN|nr:ATP-binding protein [Actinacidiphila oryziradicis]TKA00723.1 sensor histidine kinase [Actinacidiphila oryziradicis]
MNPSIPDVLPWLLALAVVAAGLTAAQYRKSANARAARIEALEQEARDRGQVVAQAIRDRDRAIEARDRALQVREEEVRHLVEHRVPALVGGLRQGRQAEVPGLLHPQDLADSPFAYAQDAVLVMFGDVAVQAAEQAEDATQAAVRTVMRSIQALLNEQQGAIAEMIDRHDDPKMLADAMAIDHAGSQLARRAAIIAVLTGSWPGRQREAKPLLEVVRGGISRIRDYNRVKVTGDPSLYVVSRAVEPVVLAVSELLDNAARHSEPGSDVRVWFVDAHNGVGIVIDDSGIGLKPEDRPLAARLLSGQEPVRLTQLRNPPRLGFLAVGALSARYGFRASVDQESDFGGVRAIVYLPRELLTTVAEPSSADRPSAADSFAKRAPDG